MLRKLFLIILRGLDCCDRAIAYSWWILIGAAILVTWEVIMRYVFWLPHDWFPAISVIVCTGLCLLGAGRTTHDGRHITLEILYIRLNKRWRRIADLVSALVTIIVCVIMSVYTLQWAVFLDSSNIHHADSLETPISIMAYAVFAAMVLGAIYSLGIVVRICLGMPIVGRGLEAVE